MIDKITLNQKWLDKLLPEGLPIPSSTIISGPGGSGKPIVATIFLASWLRHGGDALVFLINSDRTFVEHLLVMYGITPSEYKSQIIYIDFDPSLNSIKQTQANIIKSNILNPDILEKSIETGIDLLHPSHTDIMLYGAALNILFFSPTWKEKIFEKWKEVLFQRTEFTSIFTVSTSAFQEKILQLENLADNLMYTRIEKPMTLFFKIARIKGANFIPEEVSVPLTKGTLQNLKIETDKFRKRIIPVVSSI